MNVQEATLGQAMALMAYREGHAPKKRQGGHGNGTRVDIMNAISAPMTTAEVARAIGRQPDTIRSALLRLKKDGKLTSEKIGGAHVWRRAQS